MIQELEEVPRIDRVVHKLCLEFATRRVVWEGLPGCTGRGNGITVLFFMHVTNYDVGNWMGYHISVRAKCRGMVYQTDEDFVDHEKETGSTAHRRKFTAAWR